MEKVANFERIVEANKLIKTKPIRGKEYAEVPQKVKAFRFLYPMGSIETELVSDDGNRCVFRAYAKDDDGRILGTGTAFEERNSSPVNKTSYIENCETSAVGRALSFLGLGSDTSIASFEEVENAIEKQEGGNMQPLPQMQKDKPKKAAAPKQEPQEATPEQAQKQGAYPSREEMIKVAMEHYPEGSAPYQKLLASFGVNDLNKASTAQLMAVYNKYANK